MTRSVLLGDIVRIRRGASPRPIQDYIQSKPGIPWVKIADATAANSRFINSTKEFIKEEGRKKSVEVSPGTLILSNSATPGLPMIMNIGACVHDGWLILDELEGVDRNWLYYYLLNRRDASARAASGSVFSNLKTDIVRRFKVELPDIETQKKIADILWTIDEKIGLNRKMNETLEQIARALFRRYFIDNPESEKWKKKTLGVLCDVKIGRTPPRKESEWFDEDSGEAWVSIKDMGQGMIFISDSSEYLTEDAVAIFNVPVIEPNTLLLSFKLTVGRLCISTKKMYSNEAIAQLPIKTSEIGIEYLYYFLRNFNYNQLSSTSSIATAVNSTTVKNIEVIVPDEDSMNNFTSEAHDILEAVKNNEAEIQTLTTLRDILLPRLINGKVKV